MRLSSNKDIMTDKETKTCKTFDPDLPFLIKSEHQAREEGYSEVDIGNAKNGSGLLESSGHHNVFLSGFIEGISDFENDPDSISLGPGPSPKGIRLDSTSMRAFPKGSMEA